MTTPSTSAQGPDLRREEQLRIQAVGAAISRREWWEVEQAYNAIRDEFDRRPASPSPAASPASPSGVRVKPLEWHRVTYGWLAFEEWYRIEDNGPNWTDDRFWLYERGDRLGKFGTLEDAQAAMQVRHDQRIIASLASDATPAPTSGSEATCNASLQVAAIPRAENTGRYLAETNDGRLLYLNHANQWQEMPNILAKPASEPAGGDVRDSIRAAVLRGTADEVNGQPNGNIITKGCEAAEYCGPEDATGSFVDAVVDEVIAALSSSAGPAVEAVTVADLEPLPGHGYSMPSNFPAHPAPATVESANPTRRDDPFRPAVDVDADDDYYPSREED